MHICVCIYVCVCVHDIHCMCCVHVCTFVEFREQPQLPVLTFTLFEIGSIAVCHSVCQATRPQACRGFLVATSRLAFRKAGITEAQYCVWLYTGSPALGLPHSARWLLTVNSNKH